jgi:hypothetical protein
VEARLICSGSRWKWEHVDERYGRRTGGVFRSHMAAFRDLERRVGRTLAVELLRGQVLPSPSECRVALGELLVLHGK